jgi:hypothetical protein
MKRTLVGLALALSQAAPHLRAQSPAPDPGAAVRERDAQFWSAYNACDVKAMSGYFTDDVEFYHDRGGPTLGRASLEAALAKGLCGNPDSRLRRDAVPGTVQVFPMSKGQEVYGAVMSGQHVFYVIDKGGAPRLDGRARFTHLWALRGGTWRMSRVLSYDHGPADRAMP